MISIEQSQSNKPYEIFYRLYYEALSNNQNSIEACCISSFSKTKNKVSSRFVNLKYIHADEWIFFSNYNSPKAEDFNEHNQIAVVFFWNKINFQIRINASIKKTSRLFNKKYFINRSEYKNALAISSNQSSLIDSYESVKKNYNKSLASDDLKQCPDFWGGYSFTPYCFEFWEGNNSRLNKRDLYEKNGDNWYHSILQP